MELRKTIDKKGLKHKWLAEQIGVSSTMLSLYLSGERNLSEEKEKMLKGLLS